MIAGKAASLITFAALMTAAASFSAAAVISGHNAAVLEEYRHDLVAIDHALQQQFDTVSYRQNTLGARLARSGALDELLPDDAAPLPPFRPVALGAAPRSGVVITSPADKALVAQEALVKGTLDASVKEDIWVVVWPERTPGMGWPQSPNAARGAPAVLNKKKNEWSTPVAFGGPAQSYEIAVYTATKEASAKIGSALKAWAKAKDYPGMASAELEGLTERSRITVSKR